MDVISYRCTGFKESFLDAALEECSLFNGTSVIHHWSWNCIWNGHSGGSHCLCIVWDVEYWWRPIIWREKTDQAKRVILIGGVCCSVGLWSIYSVPRVDWLLFFSWSLPDEEHHKRFLWDWPIEDVESVLGVDMVGKELKVRWSWLLWGPFWKVQGRCSDGSLLVVPGAELVDPEVLPGLMEGICIWLRLVFLLSSEYWD